MADSEVLTHILALFPVAQFPVSTRLSVLNDAAYPFPVFPAYIASMVCVPENAGWYAKLTAPEPFVVAVVNIIFKLSSLNNIVSPDGKDDDTLSVTVCPVVVELGVAVKLVIGPDVVEITKD